VKKHWRPKLRTLFIVISLIILSLPLTGISILRLYESALIRQTESSLIAQASWLIEDYKQRLIDTYPDVISSNYGNPLIMPPGQNTAVSNEKWQPLRATLDLNYSPVLAQPPDALPVSQVADQRAIAIGQQLQALLKEVQKTTLAGMRIVDSQGIVIASTGGELGLSLSNRTEVRQALSGHAVRVLRRRISDEAKPLLSSISRAAEVRIFLAHPVQIEQRVVAVVILSRTPLDIMQVLYEQRHLLILSALVLFLIVILLAWFTSFSISKPIQRLIRQANAANKQQQAEMPTLMHPLIDEIDQLSRALHKMVAQQNQRADYINNFAAQVSHEFKTPICAIKGSLELLYDHRQQMSEQEVNHFLNNIEADISRMQRLMMRLTELARADTIKTPNTAQNLLPVVQDLIQAYKHRIAISLDTDSDDYPVFIAREILDSLLSNLIENACQHGGDSINISCRKNKQQLILLISDNGRGISAHNADKIFTPFFTTARKKGGTGLGLAISKTLIQAHQGDIKLLESETGCTFKLTFTLQILRTIEKGL